MNYHLFSKILLLFIFLFLGKAAFPTIAVLQQQELPNILWLTSEDNSPMLGCYGDEVATTPNLDQLAGEGFMYTHAYANAPVCAPSRNTIITGVYANSGGHQHMRSDYTKSAVIHLLPEYLRAKGYYCTNNSKEDYNIAGGSIGGGSDVWDESSKNAHYRNRKPGQPFFAVFNTGISHESSLHQPDQEQTVHDPEKIKLAPYHPDTKAMRHDYARYYDVLERMDTWIGEKLKELEDAGLAENTIVIYYSDHGGILGRSKRFIYETGTRVPFIVRIPKKFKQFYPAGNPGSSVDRLISLVDLLPTMLSLVDIPVPGYIQGNAFLGPQKTVDPAYVHMFRGRMDERIDMSRAVRDKQYRYIRNYMPYRIYAQYIDYLWKAPSMRSWEESYLQGDCNEIQSRFFRAKPVEELYHTEKDPWEVNNLAGDPAYRDVLLRMRAESSHWMSKIHDTGFIPEAEIKRISADQPLYDFMRSGAHSIDGLIAVSDLANFAKPKDIPKLKEYLVSENSLQRYWAACGLLQLGDKAKAAAPALKNALDDPSPDVAITAAEALYKLGLEDEAMQVLLAALEHAEGLVRLHALNVIDNTCKVDKNIEKAVSRLQSRLSGTKSRYEANISRRILEKAGSAK